MKKRTKIIIIVACVIVVAALLPILINGGKTVVFNTATVSEGRLETIVMATGYIQPVEEVEVGTQVSGVIEEIYADYNSHVTKGQLLAKLETNTLEDKVTQARATLRSAQSELDYSRQNYERVKKLYDAKAATQVSYEEAVNRLSQAETSLENSQANLSQSEVNLSYAYIYSPIDGVVLERAVNSGQTVAASFNTPTLFTIAEDLTKMQVEADVDEADIGQVKVGQAVMFTVDAYPDETFHGTVMQVRLQPVVTSNVVTYTVIVEAPNPDEKLFPGMTANINITTAFESGLVVPVEAFNFHVTDDIASHYGNIERSAVQGGRKVWVKQADRIVERDVQTGLGDGIYFIAHSGVSAGEEVVLSAAIGKKEVKKNGVSLMPTPPRGGGGPR